MAVLPRFGLRIAREFRASARIFVLKCRARPRALHPLHPSGPEPLAAAGATAPTSLLEMHYSLLRPRPPARDSRAGEKLQEINWLHA